MSTARFLPAVIVLTGCIVVTDGPAPAAPLAPSFTYADAGCEWDPAYVDDVVYFDVDVADGFGGDNTRAVYADVFDERSGEWVDGFELYREQEITWYSAWVGSSTWVDCRYPYQSVDLTAETWDGLVEVVTVPLVLY